MKSHLGAALFVCLITLSAHATLRVAVEGPQEVIAGQDFEYKIHIVQPPEEEDCSVLMYYIPPKQLEFIAAESPDKDLFDVRYEHDLRRIYGEGVKLNREKAISVGLTMRACESFVEEEDAPSYFMFCVFGKNGEDAELYKRKGLKILSGDCYEEA